MRLFFAIFNHLWCILKNLFSGWVNRELTMGGQYIVCTTVRKNRTCFPRSNRAACENKCEGIYLGYNSVDVLTSTWVSRGCFIKYSTTQIVDLIIFPPKMAKFNLRDFTTDFSHIRILAVFNRFCSKDKLMSKWQLFMEGCAISIKEVT